VFRIIHNKGGDMENRYGELKLLTGTSHPELAKRVAAKLMVELVQVDISTFANGEIRAAIEENVRDCDLFFLQSLHSQLPVSMFEEVEFLTDCAKDSAGRISGILPWLGYCKQDRKTKPRESRSLKVVARRLSNCGLHRVMLFDLHNKATADFFDVPNDHVYLMRLLIEEFQSRRLKDVVIGGPDFSSGKRVDAISRITGIEEDCLIKKIHDPVSKELDLNKSKVYGDIAGRDIWFFDDMIQSFGTLLQAGRIAKKAGAKKLVAAAVHPNFTPAYKGKPSALQLIEDSDFDEVIVVDTIPHEDRADWPKKITLIDPSAYIANCIKYLHEGKQLSPLFLSY